MIGDGDCAAKESSDTIMNLDNIDNNLSIFRGIYLKYFFNILIINE